MQDIIFYAAANETLGMIRDYANERNSPAPVLTLGVSVCLRMRLFSSTEGAAPYPIAALNGISDWQWCMDSDFDRGTACKLAADAGGISVHTETDTVNGETMNFTEFVIPISNMNTEELAAWLGNEKMKPGLTGELVGYDSSGNAAFVLQIENFSVRNRVAGLGDPTVLDQEIVTRTQAELMIQTAVSASAAAKQDKLTSANAGVGISITSSGVISTANVPQSAVSGLPETLAAKQNSITAGYRMALVSGSTVDQARYFMIEPAITAPANNTTTVVLSAGKAYEIHAVANHAKVLLNRENPPSARTFGLEGHAEIFVANTGYIQTGSNVVLANALEPDAVNNCTVRFHDGLAIISVEDHVAGYIVVSATGSTAGTLPYALTSASQEYVAFDATLNGQTLDLGGAVTNGEKHVVGNGYTETVISGGINCTSKTTVANLGMNGVVVSSGTLTLGDVFIPAGGTVSVSGGGLAVEKVTGNGGTIDLGGTVVSMNKGGTASVAGLTMSGGSGSGNGGCCIITSGTTAYFSSCSFIGNVGSRGGALSAAGGARVYYTDCLFAGNTANQSNSNAAYIQGAVVTITGCTFSETQNVRWATSLAAELAMSGYNKILSILADSEYGTLRIFSSATVDLTGNTNATPINPGVGVIVGSDVQIYPSAGSASSVEISGGTYTAITSGGILKGKVYLAPNGSIIGNATLDLDGTAFYAYGANPVISGVTISGGVGDYGGGIQLQMTTSALVKDVTFIGNIATAGGNAIGFGGGAASGTIESCTFTGTTNNKGAICLVNSSFAKIKDCSFDENDTIKTAGPYQASASFEGVVAYRGLMDSSCNCALTIASGATLDLTDNSNATPINPRGGITIHGGGLYDPTKIVYSSGGSVDSRTFEDLEIKGATITNLGLVYGATVYSLADSEHAVEYTEDDGATSSSVVISGETAYVVPGALVKVTNT